jgi:hypothetical protein
MDAGELDDRRHPCDPRTHPDAIPIWYSHPAWRSPPRFLRNGKRTDLLALFELKAGLLNVKRLRRQLHHCAQKLALPLVRDIMLIYRKHYVMQPTRYSRIRLKGRGRLAVLQWELSTVPLWWYFEEETGPLLFFPFFASVSLLLKFV